MNIVYSFQVLAVGFALGFSGQAKASICGNPMGDPKICGQMSNLRSHIMVLEAQRDLLQLNYGLLQTVGASLSNAADETVASLPPEFAAHADVFAKLSRQAKDVAKYAEVGDARALTVANTLRTNCATCHTQTGGASGKKWDEIFKSDWNKITEKCNTPGRNPFACKQMHGLISNYSYILNSYLLNQTNFEMLGALSDEMVRIANLLIENRVVHGKVQAIEDVAQKSALASEFSKNKNQDALKKAYEIVDSCMNCHSSTPGNPLSSKIQFNYFSKLH